jgi:hypothetical protein
MFDAAGHFVTARVQHEMKAGGRVLRADDIVKITGLRGLFTIKSFRVLAWGDIEVTVYGGPDGGVRMFRTVAIERIGTRKRLAGAA